MYQHHCIPLNTPTVLVQHYLQCSNQPERVVLLSHYSAAFGETQATPICTAAIAQRLKFVTA